MNTKQLLAAVCPKKNNYISSFLRMLIFALHREGRGGGGGGGGGSARGKIHYQFDKTRRLDNDKYINKDL